MVKVARRDPSQVLKRVLKRDGKIKVKDLLVELMPNESRASLGSVNCPNCKGTRYQPHQHGLSCSECYEDNAPWICGKEEGSAEPCTRCKGSGQIPLEELFLKPE